jgi:hypothetical protein
MKRARNDGLLEHVQNQAQCLPLMLLQCKLDTVNSMHAPSNVKRWMVLHESGGATQQSRTWAAPADSLSIESHVTCIQVSYSYNIQLSLARGRFSHRINPRLRIYS